MLPRQHLWLGNECMSSPAASPLRYHSNASRQFTVPFTSVQSIEKKMTAYVIPNAVLISTPEQRYFFASFISRDTTFEVLSNIWRLARPSIDDADRATFSDGGSVLASDGQSPRSMSLDLQSPTSLGAGADKIKKGSGSTPGPAITAHRPTACDCGKKKQHYSEIVMDTVLPGTPEKVYNLMFASGFVKDFMAKDQKLLCTYSHPPIPLLV